MAEAAFWGFIGAVSLIVGAWIAFAARPSHRVIGLIMAFGAGMLITSVSFELIGDALIEGDTGGVAIAMLLGAVVYYAADRYIASLGGDRPGINAAEDVGNGPAIALGTLLDGIPESFVLGMTIVSGGSVSIAFLAAVCISNLSESISATASLTDAGWRRARVFGMWALIVAVSAIAAAAGYIFFEDRSSPTGGRVQAFAAGAILAMLAEAMMPEGFKFGGRFVGIVTVLGFIAGVGLNAFHG
jgi:ZIP family zinc transporter